MFYYIDPGTGSMLFTILIGVLGAAIYMLRNVFMKLRFMLSGGKADQAEANRVPFAIFTDSKRYWNVFKPICDALERRGESVLYLTASPDDPALEAQYSHVQARFVGEGNRAFARMNMLKADVVLSSTPGLDVYQWKRSRDVLWYVHVLHAANEVTAYRMFGIDYFDAVMLSGEYQARQVRQLEEKRHLPAKELPMIGLPHMDAMRQRLLNAEPLPKGPTTVLIAPSWGSNAIFSKYGGRIIDALLKTDMHIIIRPHPQSYTAEKELLDGLMQAYPNGERIEWDKSNDNFDVLRRADIMISDFSGVIFDFTLVFDKPIIYADTSFDKSALDAWWLEEDMWTFSILDKLGLQLTPDALDALPDMIHRCLNEPAFQAGRDRARQETWANIGQSAEKAADYLVATRQRLLAEQAQQRSDRAKGRREASKDDGASAACA